MSDGVSGNYTGNYQSIFSKVDSGTDKLIKKGPETGGKAPSALSKARVAAEVCTPISSRSILALVVAAPIYLAMGLGKGISEMVSKGSVSSFGEGFMKGAGGIKKQATGGISDSYTDLTKTRNADKGQNIAKANLHYAGYLDGKGVESEGTYATSVSDINFSTDEKKQQVQQLFDEIKELGFATDSKVVSDTLKSLLGFGADESIPDTDPDSSKFFYHVETGSIFKLAIDYDKKEIMFCFYGLGTESQKFKETDNDTKSEILKNSIKQTTIDALGHPSKASTQAIKLGAALKRCAEGVGFSPVAVGHSHGGSLAQCAAVANNMKGVVFNSQPMGAGTRRLIGQKKIAKNAGQITAFSGQGDWLSRTRALNIVGILFERITGLPVPRTVGKGYNLPKGDGLNNNNQHNDYYSQLNKLLKTT